MAEVKQLTRVECWSGCAVPSDFIQRFDIILTQHVKTNDSPDKMTQEEYEEELQKYYQPHIHYTDEVRVVEKGGCYFDVLSHLG